MARFAQAAPTVPKMIRQTVEARLQEYAGRNADGAIRRRTFRRAAWQRRLSSQSSQRAG